MLLTVFTPTYNRREELKRVYESLKNQTSQEFIWLIVDDGSEDDTRSFVEGWTGQSFEIRYYYQENGGKMRAHNTGSRLCDTELFVCLDSDDVFAPMAVEWILKTWEGRHEKLGDSGEYAGIVAYKGDSEEQPFLNAYFPELLIKKGYSTLRGLYLAGFYGETTLVYAAKFLKKYPFPEIEGEKYVPEDYIYDKIDEECPLIVLGQVLTVCELMEGGYTDNAAKLRRENPTGWYLYYEQRSRIQKWSVLKVKYLGHYIIFARILDKKTGLKGIELLLGNIAAALLRILGKT